jgi:dihydroorotate dehydrogenase/Pyruvate/2-oxoacid:ferredoxin oxidoreductase delta subunit
MADLSVTFAGKKLRTPIGVSSHALTNPGHDPQALADHLKGYVDVGAAFVHTPFINPELKHPKGMAPAYKFMPVRSTEPFAMEGLLVACDAERIMCRLEDGLKLVELLKKSLPPDVIVISNLIGPGSDAEGWAEHCKKFENAGTDMIEMNVSCPLPAATAEAVGAYAKGELSEAAGALLGDSPALLIPVVEAVVKAVTIPVGVKLTPETGFPRLVGLAEAIKKAGAKFISGINAPITCSPPDIYNEGKAKWVGIEDNMICAALGPMDRFLCYRNLATLSMFVPGIDLAAIGGLVEPEHVVEAMMLGGRICEFSSGLFWRGTDLIKDTVDFLENKYMPRMGYKSVEDFIGIGVSHIKPMEEIDWRMEEFVSTVDDRKCIRCGACANSICMARTLKENPLRIEVDEDLCYGCGLCQSICPANAISIIEKKHKVLGVSFIPSG